MRYFSLPSLSPLHLVMTWQVEVLVHLDEHTLIRDLSLQPAGPRIAEDGTRCLQRMSKRKTDDGWESVDHM